jgi:hypothetical protein
MLVGRQHFAEPTSNYDDVYIPTPHALPQKRSHTRDTDPAFAAFVVLSAAARGLRSQ